MEYGAVNFVIMMNLEQSHVCHLLKEHHIPWLMASVIFQLCPVCGLWCLLTSLYSKHHLSLLVNS